MLKRRQETGMGRGKRGNLELMMALDGSRASIAPCQPPFEFPPDSSWPGIRPSHPCLFPSSNFRKTPPPQHKQQTHTSSSSISSLRPAMEHSGLSASMAQNISLSSLLRNASLQNTLATSPTSASTDLSGLSANLSNLVSNTNTVFRYPQSLHPYPSPTLSDSQLPISLQSWQTNPLAQQQQQQQANACNEIPSIPRAIDLRQQSTSQREDRRRSPSPQHHRQSKSDDSPHEDEEAQSTTSEFVKKLYK